MKTQKINFADWFDPKIPNHIEAFLYLEKTGTWPEGFGNETSQENRSWWWLFAIAKLAHAWIDYINDCQKDESLM